MATAADVSVALHVSDGPVKEADATVRRFAATLRNGVPAAVEATRHSSEGLESKLRELRSEVRGHERLFGFFGKRLAAIVPIAAETGSALTGMFVGLATGNIILAGLEAAKLVIGHFKEAGEEARKAAEEAEKAWKAHLDSLDKRLTALRDKLLELQGLDPEKVRNEEETKRLEAIVAAKKKAAEETKAKVGFADYGDLGLVETGAMAAKEAVDALAEAQKKLNEHLERTGAIESTKGKVKTLEDQEAAKKAAEDAADAAERARIAEEGRVAALSTQLGMLQARDDFEKAEVERFGKLNELQTALKNGTMSEAEFTLQAAVAQERYLAAVEKSIAAQAELAEKQRLAAIAHRRELDAQNADLYRAQALQAADDPANESAGMNLGKNLSESMVEAQKNAADAAKKYAAQVRTEWEATGQGIASSFQAVGAAIGGSVGSQIGTIGALVAEMVALAVANQGQGDPYTAFARVAAMAALMVGTIASLPKYDVGAWNISSDHLATVHKGEMIVPARGGQADMVRDMLSGMTTDGGGSTFIIQALDSKSFEDSMRDNRSSLQRVLRDLAMEGRRS